MAALVYGFVHAATRRAGASAETIGSFAVGLVLLAAFVVVELRAEAPITPLRLFADRNRAASYVARLLLVAGMFGMFFFLTQFLRGVLGYSDLQDRLRVPAAHRCGVPASQRQCPRGSSSASARTG